MKTRTRLPVNTTALASLLQQPASVSCQLSTSSMH